MKDQFERYHTQRYTVGGKKYEWLYNPVIHRFHLSWYPKLYHSYCFKVKV